MHSRTIQHVIVTALVVASPLLAQEAGRPVKQATPPQKVTAARQAIADDEYNISWRERTDVPDPSSAWQAPNRAHGFRAYFTTEGLRLVSRSEPVSWKLGLSLVGYGRGERVFSVKTPALSPVDNLIDFDRGRVREWYVNSRRGLKQGFELSVPPEEATDSGPSTVGARPPWSAPAGCEGCAYLVLQLTGDPSPSFTADRQAIHFGRSTIGQRLFYSGLDVRDSRARPLPAWLEGFSAGGTRGIRLVFDDSDAVYPITVDPLITDPSWPLEGDQADALHGASVATAGDVNGDGFSDVIVGACRYDTPETDAGAVYVYLGSSSGPVFAESWVLHVEAALFGVRVATAGDINGDGYSDVLVGATGYPGPATGGGAVFLFYGSESGLQYETSFTLDVANAQLGGGLGTAGDINGDDFSDVIMGAPGIDAAFVYKGSASDLIYDGVLQSDYDGGNYGGDVGTAGDVNGDGFSDVVIGGWKYTDTLTEQGVVAVYHGSATGIGDHTTPLDADWYHFGETEYASWGFSVATAGDCDGDGYSDVVVGAPGSNLMFVYRGSSSGITYSGMDLLDGPTGSGFGSAVAAVGDIDGDRFPDLAVGAPYHTNDETEEGSIVVYCRCGSRCGSFESDVPGARLGSSVAAAGDVNGDGLSDVIAGAPMSSDTHTGPGRAYVFPGSLPGQLYYRSDIDGPTNSRFGQWAAAAGDINGDGFAEIIVGAPDDAGGLGVVRVYTGPCGPSGPCLSEVWRAEGDQPGARFGIAVGTAGDVNGDGYSDIIIGADFYSDNSIDETEEGWIFVYHGSASGLPDCTDGTCGPADASWIAQSNQANGNLGWAVGSAGDVNGDGFSDVIVGAPGYGGGGEAFVYHGSSSGLDAEGARPSGDPENADWRSIANTQLDHCEGYSVATAGDVNRDGYSDIIFGDPCGDDVLLDEGWAYVYHGGSRGLGAIAAASMLGWIGIDPRFGNSVGTAGDVNGDGFSDIIVGAPGISGLNYAGDALVWHGSEDGLELAWHLEGYGISKLGQSVGTAGDVNGDGFSDVVVGLGIHPAFPSWANGLVFLGSESGIVGDLDDAIHDDIADNPVGTAGDINGDGFAEVIAGCAYSGLCSDTVNIYWGARPRTEAQPARQIRSLSDDPIAHLGASDDPVSFRLTLLGRTPFGRGRVKFEREVKPFGTDFDGTGTEISPTWVETGAEGAPFDEPVGGLTSGTLYHWRARLHYHPFDSSWIFPLHSSWFTAPWNGWEEADLRTAAVAAGRVPDQPDWPGAPLLIGKEGDGQITLTWDVSCLSTDNDYAVYEGVLGDFESHQPLTCTTTGLTGALLDPGSGDYYYIVVPCNAAREGSYGKRSNGLERPQSSSYCLTQEIGVCQ